MNEAEKARIGILISGRGSNMVALIEAAQSGKLPNAGIAVVISDQASAPGLAKAQAHGIETLVIARSGRSREEHDREMVAELKKRDVDLICLAGYMRILSNEFLATYRGRIMNIHPSLLPAFPGLDPQRQALEHGAKLSGCTVHFVDETLDGGPVIARRTVQVNDDDTVETLSARILEQEHELYPEAVKLVLENTSRNSMAGTKTEDDPVFLTQPPHG